MTTMLRNLFALALTSSPLAADAANAASPPPLLNYQGVLRDAADKPRSGSFDMVFRFFSAQAAGNEILVDSHLAANALAVTVGNGLFNAQLGGGIVTDGAGPGTYTSLADLFRDHSSVWLQVEVGPGGGPRETLNPRVQIVAAAYAMNASSAQIAQDAISLGGLPAASYLQTGSAPQSKLGPLGVDIRATANLYGLTATANSGQVAGSFYNNLSYVELAGNYGVYTYGQAAGGLFEANGTTSDAQLATGNWGIVAKGNWGGSETSGAGGSFGVEFPYTGTAEIAVGDAGMLAQGDFAGGIFRELDSGAQAYLGYNSTGVAGYANNPGENPGFFEDRSSGTFVSVGQNGFKVKGTGNVSFVQNHPYDPEAEIVYTAPEGDEAAVYTRGISRLVRGEVRVPLGETFRLVANPDIGLTAHLTARGAEPVPLSIVSLSTEELVVRGPAGSDAPFDYLVWGLRIGFEEWPVVRPKERNAPIPSRARDNALLDARPELRAMTPLARYAAMSEGVSSSRRPLDLTHSRSLAAAIDAASPAHFSSPGPQGGRVTVTEPATPSAAVAPVRAVAPSIATSPVDATTPFPAGALPAAVSERVEGGDVLAADPLRPGVLVRAFAAADPATAGIVAGECGVEWIGEAPLAFAGTIVVVKADASAASIAVGDLLVSSALPGHAMKAPESAAPGTIVAKALEPLAVGTGAIRVLVMAR